MQCTETRVVFIRAGLLLITRQSAVENTPSDPLFAPSHFDHQARLSWKWKTELDFIHCCINFDPLL